MLDSIDFKNIIATILYHELLSSYAVDIHEFILFILPIKNSKKKKSFQKGFIPVPFIIIEKNHHFLNDGLFEHCNVKYE